MNHAKIKDASIMEDMLLTTRVLSTATRLSKMEFIKKSYLASEYFQLRVNHEIKRGFVKMTFN